MDKYSIENFICDNHSICREERQYALFLYNILCRYGSTKMPETLKDEKETEIAHIFQVCQLENVEIEQIFYEASFMRDIFYQSKTENKVSFNNELINYICKKIKNCNNDMRYDGKINNLGHNQLEREKLSCEMTDEQFDELNFTARCMMNVKPDIAVLYKENGERYFLFLECKFETKEKPYKDKKTSKKLYQREVQWMVADFLCNCYFEKKITLSVHMEEQKSSLVQFIRKADMENSNEIEIETLIRLNHDILYRQDNNVNGNET